MRLRPYVPVSSGAAALCLIAPWARSGAVDRSSIELLSSASALELLGGVREWLVLCAWLALPVAAAVAIVASAWGRHRIGAFAALPIGPTMVVALIAVRTSPLTVLWGAWFGAGLGLTASLLASLVLMDEWPRRRNIDE